MRRRAGVSSRLRIRQIFVFQKIPGVLVDFVREGIVVVIVFSELNEMNPEIFFEQQVSRFARFIVKIGAFAVADVDGHGRFPLGSADDPIIIIGNSHRVDGRGSEIVGLQHRCAVAWQKKRGTMYRAPTEEGKCG